jgi:glycosyltransferase involved in cell wall biosynthesis
MRVLFVVNAPEFFLSHRLPIALAARKAGYTVNVATADGEAARQIREHGFSHYVLPLSRSGRNPLAELRNVGALWRLFRSVKPDIVHLVTIKPVLYGGLAARLAGVPGLVAAVSGLGTVFMSDGARATPLKHAVTILYRLALGHRNMAVIFQNPDDQAVLTAMRAVTEKQARRVRGSGVVFEECPCVPEPEGRPVVTMAARLLRDKGVGEFVEAARILAERNVDVTFRLIGSPDPGNPTSVTAEQLAEWRDQGIVELLGYRDDIPSQYAQSHIVCLPSYREGLPKSLLEAAACGRAVVTTDVPGCRDAIEPGKTGVLVPPRDAVALADAIQDLVEDPMKRRTMGQAGRRLAEREFGIERVVEAHLAIYRELEARA